MSPIWFGVIVVKVLEIGMLTPPVGLNVYTVKGAAGDMVSLEDVFRGCLLFFLIDLVTLTILIMFPVLSLWLPGLMR